MEERTLWEDLSWSNHIGICRIDFLPWILDLLAHADRAESFLVILAGSFGLSRF